MLGGALASVFRRTAEDEAIEEDDFHERKERLMALRLQRGLDDRASDGSDDDRRCEKKKKKKHKHGRSHREEDSRSHHHERDRSERHVGPSGESVTNERTGTGEMKGDTAGTNPVTSGVVAVVQK